MDAPHPTPTPQERAWSAVLNGVLEALCMDGVPEADRRVLLRLRTSSARLARDVGPRRPLSGCHLELVDGD